MVLMMLSEKDLYIHTCLASRNHLIFVLTGAHYVTINNMNGSTVEVTPPMLQGSFLHEKEPGWKAMY